MTLFRPHASEIQSHYSKQASIREQSFDLNIKNIQRKQYFLNKASFRIRLAHANIKRTWGGGGREKASKQTWYKSSLSTPPIISFLNQEIWQIFQVRINLPVSAVNTVILFPAQYRKCNCHIQDLLKNILQTVWMLQFQMFLNKRSKELARLYPPLSKMVLVKDRSPTDIITHVQHRPEL